MKILLTYPPGALERAQTGHQDRALAGQYPAKTPSMGDESTFVPGSCPLPAVRFLPVSYPPYRAQSGQKGKRAGTGHEPGSCERAGTGHEPGSCERAGSGEEWGRK